MERQIKFVVYNKNTGKKQEKTFDTLQEAINEANKLNEKINCCDFLVTTIK